GFLAQDVGAARRVGCTVGQAVGFRVSRYAVGNGNATAFSRSIDLEWLSALENRMGWMCGDASSPPRGLRVPCREGLGTQWTSFRAVGLGSARCQSHYVCRCLPLSRSTL